MNPTTSRTPLFAAVAVGALALSTYNTMRLSQLATPDGVPVAALPQAATTTPEFRGETTVPAASTVHFPATEAPAPPSF